MTDYFKEVKSRVSMRECAEICGFTPNRNNFICCPFHAEKTPSLKLYTDSFYCFGCQAHGDIFDFVSQYRGVSKYDAMKEFAEYSGIIISQSGKPPKKHDNKPSKSQLLNFYRKWENDTFRILNGYYKLLLSFRENLRPVDSDTELHPLFVKSLHELDYIDYLCNIFIEGTEQERHDFYLHKRTEVERIKNEYNKNKTK